MILFARLLPRSHAAVIRETCVLCLRVRVCLRACTCLLTLIRARVPHVEFRACYAASLIRPISFISHVLGAKERRVYFLFPIFFRVSYARDPCNRVKLNARVTGRIVKPASIAGIRSAVGSRATGETHRPELRELACDSKKTVCTDRGLKIDKILRCAICAIMRGVKTSRLVPSVTVRAQSP